MPASDDVIRVLIADDHPLFRAGVRALLDAARGLEVVGETASAEEAVQLAGTLQPDVVLMDLQFPTLNGIEATRQIVATRAPVHVLVVTMFEDDRSVFAAMRAGAQGYVLKGADPDELLRAIEAAAAGEAIFSPAVATRLIEFFGGLRPDVLPQPFPELSEREREILQLLAVGQSNHEIAHQLGLSPKTVANYVSTIFSKLQVADRVQAMLRAREAGLG